MTWQLVTVANLAIAIAYFDHDLDVVRTAQALHLHPNSLRYRLARVEKLLGRSLKQPSTIAGLYIATLGFSKSNVDNMAKLLDSGHVGSITLIASHYFKGTSPDIYTHGLDELTKRGQRFLSIRSHAKLLAIKLSDGRTVTIEASANLRSCKNIEQLSVFGDPGLYAFHAGWMEEMFK